MAQTSLDLGKDGGRSRRVNIDEKRMINCKADLNQLVPIKYNWAWDTYQKGCANNWMPTEIAMQRDIEMWNASDVLTDDERLMLKRNFGYFSTAESLAANNIVLGTYRLITNPECRQYLLRQAFEEAVHVHAYQYIVQSLSLDEREIFNMYNEVPCIADKDVFCLEFIDTLTNPEFKTGTPAADRELLKSLIVFAMIMEGMFFYVGFAQVLALGRQNKMPGTSEQIQYILRDESLHLNFGVDVINTIRSENPHLWDAGFEKELCGLFERACELEYQYAEETMPRGVVGLNKSTFKEYLRFVCNRRLGQIGIGEIYDRKTARNTLEWMSEMADLKKEKNFFETRVIDYQTGGALEW